MVEYLTGGPFETVVVDPPVTTTGPGFHVPVLFRLAENTVPLFGYSLSITAVPAAGAQGTVTVDLVATNFFPSQHLILADPGGAVLDPLFSVILPSGQGGVFVNANTADLSTVIAEPGINDVLVQVWLNASEDASGTFALVLGSATALSDDQGFAVPFVYEGGTVEVSQCAVTADYNGDGQVSAIDLGVLLGDWGSCPTLPSDLDDDGVVGPADLATLLGAWGPCTGCPADLNADGSVDAADLSNLLGDWGLALPACADLDCDGKVDPVDLGLMLSAWGS